MLDTARRKLILQKLSTLTAIIFLAFSSIFLLEVYFFSDLSQALHLFQSKFHLFVLSALLLASFVLVTHLIRTNELATLRTNGMSPQSLFVPFYVVAIVASLLLLGNYSFGSHSVTRFSKKKNKGTAGFLNSDLPLHVNLLPNGDHLVFSSVTEDGLNDVYWLKQNKEITYCSNIHIEEEGLIGVNIENIAQSPSHTYELVSQQETSILPDYIFKGTPIVQDVNSISLGRLFKYLYSDQSNLCLLEKRQLETILIYRLMMFIYPFLIITFLLPYLLQIKKQYAPLQALFNSLLFFASLLLWIKVGSSFGQSNLISPFITLALAPIVLQILLSFRLHRQLN